MIREVRTKLEDRRGSEIGDIQRILRHVTGMILVRDPRIIGKSNVTSGTVRALRSERLEREDEVGKLGFFSLPPSGKSP
jgi:hypothetical protein